MLNIESENGTPLDNQIEKADQQDEPADDSTVSFDYKEVRAVARIALYDDLRSAPRVTEIHPAPTAEFIESLASKIYEQARAAGGTIPYTVIREVSENFIHARFAEATVSILDEGNTIRFADQGPGIPYKDQAQIPGFTSAIEPMKHYIRGVGSGLPIVKDYLDFSHGTITIEDNLGTGAVVTISLRSGNSKDEAAPQDAAIQPAYAQDPAAFQPAYPQEAPGQQPAYPLDTAAHQQAAYQSGYGHANPPYPLEAPARPAYGYAPEPGMPQYQPQYAPRYQQDPYAAAPQPAMPNPYYQQQGAPGYRDQGMAGHYPMAPLIPPLSQRERDFLPIFLNEGALGVTDLSRLTGVPQSSTYVTLSKLEESGLIEKTVGQKRILTDLGYHVANSL